MKGEPYPLQKAEGHEAYFFESVGPRGTILKIVEFSWLRKNVWNLGFGDVLENGDWDDSVISNNSDLSKIMVTVLFAAQLFAQKWPNRRLEITPFDQRRSQLYHRIIERNEADLKQLFTIKGVKKGKVVGYRNGYFFDAFLLTPKRISL